MEELWLIIAIAVGVISIAVAVASASVVAGVIYYAFQIRFQTRIKRTEFITRFSTSLNLTASEMYAYWNLIMS